MSRGRRWWNHWLDRATEAEAAGQLVAAISLLTRALPHAESDAERWFIGHWKKRLLKEATPLFEGNDGAHMPRNGLQG